MVSTLNLGVFWYFGKVAAQLTNSDCIHKVVTQGVLTVFKQIELTGVTGARKK